MVRSAVWRGSVLMAALVFAGCRGELTEPSEPGPLPGGIRLSTVASNTFNQVSAGNIHTCALRSDGMVECWGYDGYGQAPATRAASSGSFTQVASGNNHTCALRNDGVVECWGFNFLGVAPASRAALSGSFTQVSASYFQTCALRNDGVVECWGDDGHGQGVSATRAALSGSFTRVAAGGYHTCALRNDGVVECWGADYYGQAPATKAALSGSFTQVSAGSHHTCALRNDGVVECWGDNGQGQAPATRPASAPSFSFGGFLAPVQGPPTVNISKAGGAIPVKFSLGGDRGLNIFASGSPSSVTTTCNSGTPTGTVDATATAGNSGLSYDPTSDTYSYIWKTDKAWANTCRRLTLRFVDGTVAEADFQFK